MKMTPMDPVSGRGDVVAARRRQVAHRDDHLLLLPQVPQRRVDLLGRRDAPPGRVDAHHHRPHVVVAIVLAEQLHDLVGVDPSLPVAHRPLELDHPDARSGAGRQLGIESRGGGRLDRRPGEHQEPEQHQEQAPEDDGQHHGSALVHSDSFARGL